MRVLTLTNGGEGGAAQKLWPEAESVWVDQIKDVGAGHTHDVREIPEDLGKFDKVLAQDVLEYIPRPNMIPTLQHWAGFLKEGGELHVIVPDLLWAMQYVMELGDIDLVALREIYGDQDYPTRYRLMGFTLPFLRTLFEAAGVTPISARAGPRIIATEESPSGEEKHILGRQLYVAGKVSDGSSSSGMPSERD